MAASSLGGALDRIGELQARLPGPVAVLVALLALGAVALPDLWLVTRHFSVIAHEGAHATVGSALGRRVTAVTFTQRADGLTRLTSGRAASSVMAGAVGYLGPSLFGLAAAALIAVGHIIAVLWLGLVALLALLVPLGKSLRNFGLVTVIGTLLALFLVARYASVGVQVLTAYGIAWFLLLSGIKGVREDGARAQDAASLRALTRLPRGFWSGFWLLGSVAALGFGATLLV
jgi:hypothetical protein